MSKNIRNDVKTLAYVLRRTNYAEADRILNIITPTGKMSVIAKAARKSKSKLAGGVEMFSLVELHVHQGKSELGVVTGARMIKYFGRILTDFSRMELAGEILKRVSRAAENTETDAHFKIVDESLKGLDAGVDTGLIDSWVTLNLLKTAGEEVNLYRDVKGEKLDAEMRYEWDTEENAFIKDAQGRFGVDEIKIMRLMLATTPMVAMRVKGIEKSLPEILWLARIVGR